MKRYKIFILSDIGSIHTQKWVISLCKQGFEIFLFGLLKEDIFPYQNVENLTIFSCGLKANYSSKIGKLFSKINYFRALPKLKKQIKLFKPDIVHAHYASSYGLLGALMNFHPYVVSVWGSDVYDFPNEGIIYKKILKYVFKKADCILSTSHVMAKEAKKYIEKTIEITPFGVDTDIFRPLPQKQSTTDFIVGNVKTLSPKYGIDILIKAFAKVIANNPNISLLLKIAGRGPLKEDLMQLTKTLGIENKVEFVGFIPNSELVDFYNSVSVSVSVSDSESFGVVAVEAMACECPVITSDADGFTEVVENNITGIIVPKRNVEKTANAIQKLIDNPDLRTNMGKSGRKRVLKLYNWNDNVQQMIKIYRKILEKQ